MDVEKLRHNNNYIHDDEERHHKSAKSWLNAYYPIEEPACYLHGDVYFSEEAIKKIVNTPVKSTMFFCIRDISDGRPVGVNTKGREPLAYKVENQQKFRQAINHLLQMIDEGKFKADPIAWNLYRELNNKEIIYNWSGNNIFGTHGDYIAIDDYTTDIDSEKDIPELEQFIKIIKGGVMMIKVRAIDCFHLSKFNELHNIVRATGQNAEGYLYGNDREGDVFECTKEMADYLLDYPEDENKHNPEARSFIEVLEIIPEKKEEPKEEVEEKPVKKTTRRTTRKVVKK